MEQLHRHRIKLTSDREVVLEALHAQRTYIGLLDGRPTAETNGEIIRELRAQAVKLWGEGRPIHVVEPTGWKAGDALPTWACIGWLISKAIRADSDYSELLVIWFEPSVFDLPLRALAQDRLESLKWDELAQDCAD